LLERLAGSASSVRIVHEGPQRHPSARLTLSRTVRDGLCVRVCRVHGVISRRWADIVGVPTGEFEAGGVRYPGNGGAGLCQRVRLCVTLEVGLHRE
jgi:hypothetical protein